MNTLNCQAPSFDEAMRMAKDSAGEWCKGCDRLYFDPFEKAVIRGCGMCCSCDKDWGKRQEDKV